MPRTAVSDLGLPCLPMSHKMALVLYGFILILLEAIYARCIYLTPCLLDNFQHFFAVCYILFSKSLFSRISFFYTIKVSNSLDPAQARHCDGPDLGYNCLKLLSADATSRQRFKEKIVFGTIISSSQQGSSQFLVAHPKLQHFNKPHA